MENDNFASKALFSCLPKYEVSFDPRVFTIRRNLLFLSILSISSLFISPKDDAYSVNLGIISGHVNYPQVIFWGLLIVTIYQLYYFWVNCSQTVFNFANANRVNKIFFFELASHHAFSCWNALVKEHVSEGNNQGLSLSFAESPKYSRENEHWKVRGQTPEKYLNVHPKLTHAIKQSIYFELDENGGLSQIDYIYQAKSSDYKFLYCHRRQFWLTKKKQWLEYLLPIIFCGVAIMALILKILSFTGCSS